ncbi:MAG: 1,4-dihydroxy-2-naphthoate polyprenyltransferase [Actinobacteria bacterium]|nr:1,4-dihydroxy-2-naphthoate polyprenyltransferase [Actinomycetota bacterium]
MATAAQWIDGARPRTLGAAIAPVAVGTGIAAAADSLQPVRAVLALIVLLAAQVGVNYANDYSDGIRGTDEKRVGPVRLVGQGLASPAAVRAAALASLVVSAVAGLVLVALTAQWWLLTVGGCALLAAWLYTGGPKPYGYLGLGEVFVFVFFGIVPVVGTAYVQTLTFSTAAWVSSIGVGALICAILVANNLRDTPTDSSVGKRTLAVRMGDGPTRVLYVALVMSAFVVIVPLAALLGLGFAWLGFLAAPLAIRPMAAVLGGASGGALVAVLKTTGVVVLAYGLLLGLGIGLS